VTKQENCGHGS